jgi:hypothetical protein
MIDPASIKTNQYAPPVVVEQLRTDDQSAIFNNNAEISPGQTRFDFYYTAPSFVAPDKIRFKYKLDGFDRDWVDAGHGALPRIQISVRQLSIHRDCQQ